jgi:hypothetical protein
VSFDAPKEGTPRGRFGWLMRQLKEAPSELRLEAAFPNARSTTAATLDEMHENSRALQYAQDPKRAPRGFVLTVCRPMGTKRGRAEGSFVRETSAQVISFYSELVQHLKPWQAPAPKVHSPPPEEGSRGDPPPSESADPLAEPLEQSTAPAPLPLRRDVGSQHPGPGSPPLR